MTQFTVKRMAKALLAEIRKGNGDKVLVAADDPEGNGYHGVYFGITADGKEVKECIDCSNGISDTTTDDPNKIAIIG